MNIKSVLREKYGLLLILFFFFLLRVSFSYLEGWKEPVGDGGTYNHYALTILGTTDWLTNPDFSGHSRAPVYPLFLAVIYSIFGAGNLLSVYIVQGVISTLTIYYIYKLAYYVFGKGTAFVSMIWAGFYAYYIYYSGVILRETLVFFLIIYSFYHLFLILRNKPDVHPFKRSDFWWFLISFAVVLHTDARYIFYVPFLAIPFVLYNGFVNGAKQYLWSIVLLVLLLVPWTIRNVIAYDAFVLVNARTLHLASDGLVPKARVAYSVFGKSEKVSGCLSNENFPSEQEIAMIRNGRNPNDRSKDEIDAILNDRLPARNETARRWYNFKRLWRPYHFVNEYRPWPDCRFDPKYSPSDFGLIKAVSYGTLLPFMIIGLLCIAIQKKSHAYLLMLPIFVQTVLHVIMWGSGRYRNPIDSFVIILGCNGMVVVFDFLRRKTGPAQKI